MTRQEIFDGLKEILESAGDNDDAITEASEDSELVGDLGLSSISILYLVISIEETYGVSFDGCGVADFVKLKDVIDYIEAHL